MAEEQTGFRRGRGTDDALQVARRIIEETRALTNGNAVVLSFYEIEKAYPRVCRPALWRLLERRGCPLKFIRVCNALHEHTGYRVRVLQGLSTQWYPRRGLRE
eukprot:3895588-Pyramimonas_sp.AAC.1